MAGDRDSILRKLKKMAAKLGSLRELGSEAEATSFSELMQKLATEHQIEASEIAPEDREELDPIIRLVPPYAKYGIKVKQRQTQWMIDLGIPVADGHYCRLLVLPHSSAVVFVGRTSQVEVAAEVYLKLLTVAESLADKEYVKFFYEMKREGDVKRARGFRQSFLLGFCYRVGVRYAEYMEALRAYYAHDKKALMVMNHSRAEVIKWIEDQKVPKSKKERRWNEPENREGWVRGREKAEGVDLSGRKKLD